AVVHEVVRGEIDASAFLGAGAVHGDWKAAEVERWLKPNAHAQATRRHHNDHHHDVHPHDARIRAFCFYYERPIQRAGLLLWLDMLAGLRGANLLRVKALLNIEGDPVVVHAVQTVVHEPLVLDAWPSDERRSTLVFIVRDMDREAIERTFHAFDYTPAYAV